MASTLSMLVTPVVRTKHGVQCFCGSRMHGDADRRFSRDDVILCSALSLAPGLPLPPSPLHFSVSSDLVSVSFLWFLGNSVCAENQAADSELRGKRRKLEGI